ncbi:MAG: EAL domain-containing protein [Sphaerochaeta sp.]|nr:EAL domain-containing protein [Sphaerochaeta sp.]
MQKTTKPTILIADANIQNRKTFCAQLSQEYTIFEADHGPQVLQILEEESIGAVLYDYALPGLNAKEFLLLRQNNPSLDTIPTFVFADHQEVGLLLEFNPTFLIFRPYELKVLKERIRSVLTSKGFQSGTDMTANAITDGLSMWSVNASELQSGFALYRYKGDMSTPIYVDEGFLSLGSVQNFQEFKDKYPDIRQFIQEEDLASFNDNVRIAMADHTSFSFSIEMKPNARHGSELFFYASWIPYPSLPDPVFIVMVLDSTQLIENQRQLFSLIERDPLTGIYNQETFYRKTEAMLKRKPNIPHLFIRWNIERFKTVNDLFGNSAGNEILKSLGDTFIKLIGNKGTFGRLYSDQFALCIPKEGFDAALFAKETEKEINANPLKAYVHSVFGIFEITDPTMAVSLMSDRASMALNTAKGNYHRPYAYYTDTLRKKLLKKQAIVNEMSKALDLGQFQIFLQPFFSITENRFTGAEALVRWVHPERGLIGPDEFVPIFEENGFIIPLDDHIIEEVCILQHRLLTEDRPTVPIAINLSRSDFYNQDLAQNIIEKTNRYAIPHSLLMFEITESVYSENPNELIKVMRTLQNEGFLILMDDFGSGYSSLNVLKDVPVDILKLDIMFSKEIGKSERAENIIRSIVTMASLLGLPLIIEGIETREQVDFYKLIGCNTLQGFYFSKPLPIEQFLSLDMVQNRPAFITDQFFQHMDSFSLSNMQSKVLKTLFDEIYLFNYSEDRYQQLYTTPHLPSPSFPSQGSLSSFLSLIREKRILPQDRDSFSQFSQTRTLSDDQESLKQRFRWMDSKGEETTGSWSLIRMDNPSHKDLFLCCINVVDAGCGIEGDNCSYKIRYAMIEQLANIKVMEWDIEQDILYKSPNLELLQLGKISPKALIDKHYCIPFIHEEDLDTFEECVEKVIAKPKQRGTTVRLRLLNGEFRWFNIQMHMIRGKRIVASLLDVDTKMRMSEQVRSSRRKLDFLTTSAQWGIVMGHLSPEGTIVTTFHNPIFYEILGYSRTEYEAWGINFLSLLQEGEGDLLVSSLQKKQDFQLTVHITQKDYVPATVQLSVLFSPIDQVRKEFICYLFILEDGKPGYKPSEKTTPEKTIPSHERITEELSQHRQVKNSEHISLTW